jgi:hypothetical protein
MTQNTDGGRRTGGRRGGLLRPAKRLGCARTSLLPATTMPRWAAIGRRRQIQAAVDLAAAQSRSFWLK